MQLFKCHHCQRPVYFDNTYCSKCHHKLGFDAVTLDMITLHTDPDGKLKNVVSGNEFHYCSNAVYGVCNWILAEDNPATHCVACSLNRTIPDINKPDHLERWATIENAKHRLVYSLLRWNLPVKNKISDPEKGLVFDFKSDDEMPEGQRVLTGHASGVITMNISEADDVEREMAKKNMDEVYRTVLGHFRHEIGHYYWDLLIANSGHLEKFRQLYGDESQSYQEALDKYYENGAPADWSRNYISAYATMHPWESWAETWAHYMHIVDTLETAYFFGLSIDPRIIDTPSKMSSKIEENAYWCPDFKKIYEQWVPLSLMMNSLNRSMGANDIYPFVINKRVKEKLQFIHEIIHHKPD